MGRGTDFGEGAMMKAHELKEELKKGKYIIAAFGNISLWKGTDRERTIHPNVFHALIKQDVLHEECIESGASEFTLKTPTEKEILEARVKELEGYLERYETITQELYQWWGDDWTLEDEAHDDLIKLRQDIKRESNDE